MSSDAPSRSAPGVEGKSAVVTGAAQGIGFGIAQALASRGARVAIFDISEAAAEAAAGSLEAAHGPGIAFPHAVDLTNITDVERSVADANRQMGTVDILVNNAGVITGPTDVDQLPEEDWDRVVGTNVKSQFLAARFAVPLMKRSGFGRIINIASRSWLGVAGRAHYAASKGAVVSLTRSLAIELGPYGITANCISPTLVITPLFESTPESDQDAVMRRIRSHPIPRPGTPEDIAHGVLFFADAAASFITGQHIYIGGGADLASGSP